MMSAQVSNQDQKPNKGEYILYFAKNGKMKKTLPGGAVLVIWFNLPG